MIKIPVEILENSKLFNVLALIDLGILVPAEKEITGEHILEAQKLNFCRGGIPEKQKKCCDNHNKPTTTVAKFVDFLDKETLNPYDVRVEPTTDKEEWGEADFQALFAGYYASQNKIREFIHRAEKEAVQKERERIVGIIKAEKEIAVKQLAKGKENLCNDLLSLITNKGDTNN